MTSTPILLNFMIEKREGLGEDSDPLSFQTKDNNFLATGVFDGLGGAGALAVNSRFGIHSSAYVASRLVKDRSLSYIKEHLQDVSLSSDDFYTALRDVLQKEKDEFPTEKKSSLRSTIVREYPTTLSVIVTHKKGKEQYELNSFWAGDSRNYLLVPHKGLMQLSKDDLQVDADPLENLRYDSPISNCICLNREFIIHSLRLEVSTPFVIISASDGCFGYLKTPMHFEHLLLGTMASAKNIDNWRALLTKRISEVAADDVSMSMICIGFRKFDKMKKSFSNRKKELENIIYKYDEIENSIAQEEGNIDMQALQEYESSAWNSYKEVYMRYITE